jgi:predicted secreted hydrolase
MRDPHSQMVAARVSRPRRRFLVTAIVGLVPVSAQAAEYPEVIPGRPLSFPADHGAHPAFRTEWWYVTGWVRTKDGRDLGIQITFFRSRPDIAVSGRSRFDPEQLLFAHAALADPRHGRLRHDQVAARAGFGLAEAATTTTAVRLDRWSFVLDGSTYRARIQAADFEMTLAFAANAPIVRQGDAGYSRKGPKPGQASYYYSRPHLAVSGSIRTGADAEAVTGSAWLDHEWSSEILDSAAVGWDWIGLNLEDGSALMAFRIRDADGKPLWAGGTLARPDGTSRRFTEKEVQFVPGRLWTSPRTGARYPVAMRVDVPGLTVTLTPLLDDQELDSRASVGTVYWEGAVTATAEGRTVGRGYLELTGYFRKLRL